MKVLERYSGQGIHLADVSSELRVHNNLTLMEVYSPLRRYTHPYGGILTLTEVYSPS